MKCKPGDLAIVTRVQGSSAARHVRLLGSVVTVVSSAPVGTLIVNGFGRKQKARNEGAWLVSGSHGRFLIRDSSLTPIRPGDLDEDIDAGEKLPNKEHA